MHCFKKEKLCVILSLLLLPLIPALSGCGGFSNPQRQPPDARPVAYADTSGRDIHIVNAADGSGINTITNPENAGALAFLDGGASIAVASQSGNIRIYNVQTGVCDKTINCGFELDARQIVVFPDGIHIAVTGLSGTPSTEIRLINRQDGSGTSYSLGQDVYSMAVSPDGNLLIAGGDGGRTRMWNLASLSILTVNAMPSRNVNLAFSPDSGAFATGCLDETVAVRSTSTYNLKCAGMFGGCILFFLPDGRTLAASKAHDAVLRKYSATSGADLGMLAAVNGSSFAVSRDFKAVLISCNDNMLRLLDTETGKINCTINAGSGNKAVAISW